MPTNRAALAGAVLLSCAGSALHAQVIPVEPAPPAMSPPVVRNNTRSVVTCDPRTGPGRGAGDDIIVLRPGEEKVLEYCELSILPGKNLNLKWGHRYSILRNRKTGVIGLYEIDVGR